MVVARALLLFGAVGILSALCAPGRAAILLSENWDTGTGGWTIANSSTSPGWAADGTPAANGTIGTPYASAPSSMNYNNGTDYAEGITSSGTVTSPVVALTGTTSPVVTFACNYETETSGAGFYDQRRLQVSNDSFATTLLDAQLATTGGSATVGACAAMGTWHTHTVALDPAWGSIRLRWSFATGDGLFNTYAGWFLDDIVVTATVAATAPSVSAMVQSDTAGGPPRAGGFTRRDGPMFFRADLSDPNGDTSQVEIEVKPLGAAFDGTGVLTGNVVPGAGGTSQAGSTFADGPHHWRARAVDSTGLASAWIEFDPAPGADFSITTPPADRDNPNGDRGVNDYCSQGAGGRGGGVGMAALGALAVALACGRRRMRVCASRR